MGKKNCWANNRLINIIVNYKTCIYSLGSTQHTHDTRRSSHLINLSCSDHERELKTEAKEIEKATSTLTRVAHYEPQERAKRWMMLRKTAKKQKENEMQTQNYNHFTFHASLKADLWGLIVSTNQKHKPTLICLGCYFSPLSCLCCFLFSLFNFYYNRRPAR